MKAIIEKAGDDGYKLTDNNPGNFILNEDGKITRIDCDNVHVTKFTLGGKEKAVKEALAEAKSMFELEDIDDDIWQYLPKDSSAGWYTKKPKPGA
jgi:hypothetical protein